VYLYTLLYDHKVIRVYIEIFVAEHRAVVAKVYAINVIDFLCHREARLRIFVQVPSIDYATPRELVAFAKIV